MHSTAVLATPIIVFFLLEWFVDDSQPEWPGYCLAAGFGAAGLIAACAQSCSLRCSLASSSSCLNLALALTLALTLTLTLSRCSLRVGVSTRAALCAMAMQRSLRLEWASVVDRSESESAHAATHAAACGRVPEAGDGGTASDRMDAVPLGRLAALIGRSSEEVLGYSP